MRRALFFSLLPTLSLLACSPSIEEENPLQQRSSPIVGGVIDNAPGAHEGVVLLSLGNQGGLCTGSLIAPNLVLTARHCVSNNITEGIGCDPDGNSTNGDHVSSDLPPSSIEVFNGSKPNFWGGNGIAKGKKIFHPDGYNLCNRDIALILLDKSVDSGVAPTMKLRLKYGAQIGEMTTAVGYGKTSQNSWQSGVRYRRENIKVLSVGRDYNELLGENEFLLGQSTCQGDSGGPILAQDTQSILGVTSRGGDCDKGKQRFTRVDAFKSLIESALAEAGSEAQLEGKEPPPSVDLKPMGEGPCSTGSQCQGAFCYQGMCSQICGPGLCSSGYYCLPTTVTISDQTIPDVGVCRPYTAVDECDECRHSKCKSKTEDCHLDKDCSAMFTCVIQCSTPDCYENCAAKNSKGAKLYKELHDCECSSKCGKNHCSALCGNESPGTGGAGGAGQGGNPQGGDNQGGVEGGAEQGGKSGGSEEGGKGGEEVGGMDAGSGGAETGDSGKAGASGASAGASQTGGTAGGGGVPVNPPQGTDAGTGDDGGCSVVSRSSENKSGWLFLLAVLSFRRRSQRNTKVGRV